MPIQKKSGNLLNAPRMYNSYVPMYLEGLPRAMDDRDRWRERVRDIRASSVTWCWWWWSWWWLTTSGLTKNQRANSMKRRPLYKTNKCPVLNLCGSFTSKWKSSNEFEHFIWIFWIFWLLSCQMYYFGLVWWVLLHINLCRLFNAKSIFM